MTNREFRKDLHEKGLEAIRKSLAEKNEKKKPPASEESSEEGTKVREKKA
jgi:hypothetical protein